MAEKNIQMQRKKSDGTYDSYYPITKAANVKTSDNNDIQTLITAKIDKPTSAVSGNIAVFDGGAGKLKDSGVSPSAFMVPGNTILAESLEEESISGTSQLGQKCFIMPNPGRYRITGELMSNTDGYDIIIKIGIPGVGNYIKASAEYRTSSTSYGEFSIDMTLPVSPYGLVSVVGYSDGSGKSGKIRNVRIKGVPGTADVAKVV